MPTRARIVASAAKLFRRRGYAGTGLNDVIEQSAAPRGSLYHYFPAGKEELASEAVARGSAVVSHRIEQALSGSDDLREVVNEFAVLLARNLERSGFRDGCPVGTVTLDAASESQRIGAACRAAFVGWRDTIAHGLAERGHGEDEALELATLLLCAFEGALMMARAVGEVGPLFVVADALNAHLEASVELTSGGTRRRRPSARQR